MTAIMLTSVIVLALCSGSLFLKDLVTLRNTMLNNLSTVAEVIGNNSTRALMMGDREAADEILGALRIVPDVTSAYLYNANGELFAVYSSSGRYEDLIASDFEDNPEEGYYKGRFYLPEGWEDGSVKYRDISEAPLFSIEHLDLFHVISLNGDAAGALYIEHDLAEINSLLVSYTKVGVLVFMLSVVVALLLSSRFQHLISMPLLNLADTMRQVSREKDYSIRAERQGTDAIGALVDGFNEMLFQIEARNSELRNAKDRAQLMAQQAQEADRAKSLFLANMSHELRTPLNSVIGFSEVLSGKHYGTLNSTQESYIQDIHESGKHLLSLIQDILDLSKVEAGKMDLVRSGVDIRELLSRSLHMFRDKVKSRRIELTVDADSSPETVNADELRLRQLMINLMSNAIKFTPDCGKVEVCVASVDRAWLMDNVPETFRDDVLTDIDDGCNSFVKVDVADSGIGISEHSLKLVFDPFQQEDNNISRKYGGTGLGLTLCKKLVGLHKGGIWIESPGERGCCVSFVIPKTEGAGMNTKRSDST